MKNWRFSTNINVTVKKKLKACCSRDVLAVQLILTMLYILYSYLVVVVIYCCRSLRQVSSVCQYHKRQRSSVACSWMFEHVVTLKKTYFTLKLYTVAFCQLFNKNMLDGWLHGCVVMQWRCQCHCKKSARFTRRFCCLVTLTHYLLLSLLWFIVAVDYDRSSCIYETTMASVFGGSGCIVLRLSGSVDHTSLVIVYSAFSATVHS